MPWICKWETQTNCHYNDNNKSNNNNNNRFGASKPAGTIKVVQNSCRHAILLTISDSIRGNLISIITRYVAKSSEAHTRWDIVALRYKICISLSLSSLAVVADGFGPQAVGQLLSLLLLLLLHVGYSYSRLMVSSICVCVCVCSVCTRMCNWFLGPSQMLIWILRALSKCFAIVVVAIVAHCTYFNFYFIFFLLPLMNMSLMWVLAHVNACTVWPTVVPLSSIAP